MRLRQTPKGADCAPTLPRSEKEGKAGGDDKEAREGSRADLGLDDDEDAGPAAQLQELVGDYLGASKKDSLQLLPRNVLDRAIFEKFVGKEEKDAIAKQVDLYLSQTQKVQRAV